MLGLSVEKIHSIWLALLVGSVVSLFSTGFNKVIFIGVEAVNPLLRSYPISYLLFPLLGALLTALLYRFHLREDKTGLGIGQVLTELDEIKTFLMKPKRVAIRVVAAMITLVCGLSASRFGPMVHFGSAIGSNIGYGLKLSDEDTRMIIGCGAAAAIAAVFQMPLFGAVFVLEVLYKKQYMEFFAPIVLSSLVSVTVANYFVDPASILPTDIPALPMDMPHLIGFVALGIIVGIFGIAYMEGIGKMTRLFANANRIPLHLILAALIVGGISYFLPENFETHHHTTARIIAGGFSIKLLLMIVFMKLLSTSLTLGSGFVGGNFYPAVTIGTGVGAVYGKLFHLSPSMLSFLGAGGIIAAIFNAPLSGIILALEFSGTIRIILPALLICSISTYTVYTFYGRSIFSPQ